MKSFKLNHKPTKIEILIGTLLFIFIIGGGGPGERSPAPVHDMIVGVLSVLWFVYLLYVIISYVFSLRR